jgi:predicted restriction endonuclease
VCYYQVASHIKPWAKSNNEERLDPYNGLLLLANIDKAFDLGYISFDDRGLILISEQLDDYQSLGINEQMNVLLAKQHQDYLAFIVKADSNNRWSCSIDIYI